jgi:tRNA dimethylallyltransferase
MSHRDYNCLVVIGPTASGKTRLAARLAYYLGGEVISADSRQVYKGLNIGTGKDLQEYVIDGHAVPYHLIDVTEPAEQFFLHHFMEALRRAFEDVNSRGKLPVISGGTGLYIDALRKDFSYTLAPEDHELRSELNELDKPRLLLELQRLSPSIAAGIDSNSKKRLIRGIEIARHFGQVGLPPEPVKLPYLPFYIGIDLPSKERRRRISERLQQRLDNGLIEEAEGLLSRGLSHERLQRLGLEYKFLSLFIAGRLDRDTMQKKLETAIHQFAKRQMTWFRKMEKEGVAIKWVAPDSDAELLANEIRGLFVNR